MAVCGAASGCWVGACGVGGGATVSSRKIVHVVLREPADPGEAPNATVGEITVDIRIVFPPHVDRRDAWVLYRRAVTQAERELFPFEFESVSSEPVTLDDVQGILGKGWTDGMDPVDWIRSQRDE